jgi:hypothetical protein
MGAVVVAEQLSTDKLRALDRMAPELVADPRMRDDFTLEAHARGRRRRTGQGGQSGR